MISHVFKSWTDASLNGFCLHLNRLSSSGRALWNRFGLSLLLLMNGSFSFGGWFPFGFPLENVSFCLELADDGLSRGVMNVEVLGGRIDRNILFEDHVNESLSDLNQVRVT